MKIANKKFKLKSPKFTQAFVGLGLLGLVSLYGCGGSTEYVETTEIDEPTKGVITEVEETSADLFKITDEELVEKVEDSRIIAQYLDGKRDTFTLDEARLVAADSTSTNGRRRGLSNVMRAGLMGYFFTRGFGGPTMGAYKNGAKYASSVGKNNEIRSTAKTRTVRKPVTGKSGFGKGGSTRSFGG